MRPLTEDDVRDIVRERRAGRAATRRAARRFHAHRLGSPRLPRVARSAHARARLPHRRGRGRADRRRPARGRGHRPARARRCATSATRCSRPTRSSLFTARKAGEAGVHGDSVGTYICADLSCHENVRLAAPLAPNEMRASVDRKIDGTRRRTEAFVERVLEGDAA